MATPGCTVPSFRQMTSFFVRYMPSTTPATCTISGGTQYGLDHARITPRIVALNPHSISQTAAECHKTHSTSRAAKYSCPSSRNECYNENRCDDKGCLARHCLGVWFNNDLVIIMHLECVFQVVTGFVRVGTSRHHIWGGTACE